MTSLAVLCALVCAAANAAVSALQRLAALDVPAGGTGTRRLRLLLRSKVWWAGSAALLVAAVAQAAALGLGSLSLVQPLLASELLFALLVGTLVFRRGPGRRTWGAFTALAAGLALFLAATRPRPGDDSATTARWAMTGLAVAVAVVALLAAARTVRGAPRAALLGCATATGFAMTAALIKEVLSRAGAAGFAQLWLDWPVYVFAATGGTSFLLLQATLRAGTLRVSQPALTLADALVSLVLGGVLFGDRLALGVHTVPAVAGCALIVVGVVGLSRSRTLASGWDTRDDTLDGAGDEAGEARAQGPDRAD
ncbi:DMT family transporter [Streptacidiphilus neutrinimicus]|uniref:DMT family transporter n=1 Tax=Streptacidiphilus neutrinimicus TaxID=105420 RepID=UPI0005A9ED60|nr:DMT family transporter [Streptacidiphilus neutrinimicus]